MDIRIVNTCNNNCLYCLEQNYRNKEKFIDKSIIFNELLKNKWDNILNFYWGNSLLHPDIFDIISFWKLNWFRNISFITNTYWIDLEKLYRMRELWLNQIWIYFNSIDNHEKVVNWWISLPDLLENIRNIKKSGINFKFIIHVNFLNIKTLHKTVLFLIKIFWKRDIEFINYFPFDRPYEKYRLFLEYWVVENRKNINLLFLLIKKIWINVKFIKFDKLFFWNFIEFYDYYDWVFNQIWDEDRIRLNSWITPFCFKENRCEFCFIKDNCKFYGKN